MSSSPDRRNVGTKHDEFRNRHMAPGVGPGWVQEEPPSHRWIPMTLQYLFRYALDMAYIAPPPRE